MDFLSELDKDTIYFDGIYKRGIRTQVLLLFSKMVVVYEVQV